MKYQWICAKSFSGSFPGKSASSWHSVLAGLYEGSNHGEYLETFSSSLVNISGFGY